MTISVRVLNTHIQSSPFMLFLGSIGMDRVISELSYWLI